MARADRNPEAAVVARRNAVRRRRLARLRAVRAKVAVSRRRRVVQGHVLLVRLPHLRRPRRDVHVIRIQVEALVLVGVDVVEGGRRDLVPRAVVVHEGERGGASRLVGLGLVFGEREPAVLDAVARRVSRGLGLGLGLGLGVLHRFRGRAARTGRPGAGARSSLVHLHRFRDVVVLDVVVRDWCLGARADAGDVGGGDLLVDPRVVLADGALS
mmetsp:Transcript_20898/g.62349  ORF Transcript_20898/g.62349 Transcript_20898/m.62349 type:complete len:213 (+) Transcript_20898:640-1278(+)